MKIKTIWYIFFLGLAVRLCVGLSIGYNSLDSDYAIIARSIVTGRGYSLGGSPTANRAPGYPLFLAGLMAIFGERELPFIIAMAIIGAANAALCFRLGEKLFNRASGSLAGLIYIFLPYLAYQETSLESGFVTLGLITSCLLFFRGIENKNYLPFCLCGISLAFSYLFRPTIAPIPCFLSLSLIFAGRGKRKNYQRLSAAGILMLAFFLGILPWGLRNKKVFGRWYFNQTLSWDNLYIGNHRKTFNIYPYISLDKFNVFIAHSRNRLSDEFQREEWYKQHTLSQLRRMPSAEILKRAGWKLLYLWHVRIVPYTKPIWNGPAGKIMFKGRGLKENLAFSVPYILLLILASLGCWQEKRRPRLILFLAGFLFFFSLPYMFFFGYSRYATQAYFILIILAGRGLSGVLPKTIYLTE